MTSDADMPVIASRPGIRARDTGAAPALSIASDAAIIQRWRDQWQRAIDEKLVEWGRNPQDVEDEGIDPPSPHAINRACRLAQSFRDNRLPSPDRMAPTPDGGVIFELGFGDNAETIEVDPQGAIEWILYRNGKIIDRQTWI